MRNFATDKFLAKRPDALALYATVGTEPRLEVRAAVDGKPAEILIYDEIGFWGVTAKAFHAALLDAGAGPIVLRINSPGGDVFDAMAMFNAIKQRGNVAAVVDGLAASAASFIMLAADTVTMQKTAMVMVHRAWTVTGGNGPDHLDAAALLEKIDGQIAAMYAAKTSKPEADMLALMDAETWLTSSEAVAQGFADGVMVAPAKPAAKALAAAADIARAKLRLRLAEAA